MSILSISKISQLWLVSVAEQACLCQSWSQTPKTGFLVTRLSYDFADPIPEDLAHASAPIHLDDVVSSEVINTEKPTNGHTDKNDTNYSNGKNNAGNVKKLCPGVTASNKISERQLAKDVTDQSHIFVGDNSVEEYKIETDENTCSSTNNPLTRQHKRGSVGVPCNETDKLNHPLLNGSDFEMGHLETEDKAKETPTENAFSTGSEVVADFEAASLLQSKAVLNDKKETVRVDHDHTSDLKQVSKRSTEENSSRTLVMDTVILDKDTGVSSSDTKNSNKTASDTKVHADDKVELSESETANMCNASSIQENNISNDLDIGKQNELKVNKAKVQSLNSKKRKQKDKKTAIKVYIASQSMKVKDGNKQSELFTQGNKIDFDNKAQFASFKPPKIDIVSLFKQTIGHKPLKSPHTYESAKAELVSYERDDSEVSEKHSFIQNGDRHSDHDALITAVHELQIMFDKATIRSKALENQDSNSVSLTTDIGVEDSHDKDSATNLEQQAAKNSEEAESLENKTILHINATVDKSLGANHRVNRGCSASNVLPTAKDGKEKKINQEMVVKPKKISRRGYTGKFAIAHMLHQGDFDNDDKNDDKFGIVKQYEEPMLDERNDSTEVENMNMELENRRNQGNNESSLGMLNEASEAFIDIRDSVEDNYKNLVLESQAIEKSLKHEAEIKAIETKSLERKVSFSSDEIVTEDSESDSISGDELNLIHGDQDDNQMHNYPSRKSATNEKNTSCKSYLSKEINTNRSRNNDNCKSEVARSRRKKESDQVEFEDEEYGNLEIDNFENYYDNEERNDPHLQYYSGFAAYPNSFPQKLSTKLSQRESRIRPPQTPSMPGYPHAPFPSHTQQFYPGNFYNQWYPPFLQQFQQYPMQYPLYLPYPTPPSYGPYSVPFASKVRPDRHGHNFSSSEEENMKQAFELQTDYIKLMCHNGDKGGKGRKMKKHKRMS